MRIPFSGSFVAVLSVAFIGFVGCQSESPDNASDANFDTPATSEIDTDSETPEPVSVELLSYGFETERDTFVVGQPYEFTLRNSTDIEHEWVLVPRGAQTEDNMLIEVEGDELPPGGEATITYTFEETGEYDFACYLEEPEDHYEQGMVYPVVAVEE